MATVPSRKLQLELNPETRQTLKIAIAYESFESGLHAAQVYQHLVEMLDQDFLFEVDFWRFEVLKVPSIGELGASKAAEADLVLVAVDGSSMVPVDFQLWVEKWIERKIGQDSALVLVSKPSNESAAASASILAYLQSVATRGRMTFISDSITVQTKTRSEYRAEQAVRATPVAAGALLSSSVPAPE